MDCATCVSSAACGYCARGRLCVPLAVAAECREGEHVRVGGSGAAGAGRVVGCADLALDRGGEVGAETEAREPSQAELERIGHSQSPRVASRRAALFAHHHTSEAERSLTRAFQSERVPPLVQYSDALARYPAPDIDAEVRETQRRQRRGTVAASWAAHHHLDRGEIDAWGVDALPRTGRHLKLRAKRRIIAEYFAALAQLRGQGDVTTRRALAAPDSAAARERIRHRYATLMACVEGAGRLLPCAQKELAARTAEALGKNAAESAAIRAAARRRYWATGRCVVGSVRLTKKSRENGGKERGEAKEERRLNLNTTLSSIAVASERETLRAVLSAIAASANAPLVSVSLRRPREFDGDDVPVTPDSSCAAKWRVAGAAEKSLREVQRAAVLRREAHIKALAEGDMDWERWMREKRAMQEEKDRDHAMKSGHPKVLLHQQRATAMVQQARLGVVRAIKPPRLRSERQHDRVGGARGGRGENDAQADAAALLHAANVKSDDDDWSADHAQIGAAALLSRSRRAARVPTIATAAAPRFTTDRGGGGVTRSISRAGARWHFEVCAAAVRDAPSVVDALARFDAATLGAGSSVNAASAAVRQMNASTLEVLALTRGAEAPRSILFEWDRVAWKRQRTFARAVVLVARRLDVGSTDSSAASSTARSTYARAIELTERVQLGSDNRIARVAANNGRGSSSGAEVAAPRKRSDEIAALLGAEPAQPIFFFTVTLAIRGTTNAPRRDLEAATASTIATFMAVPRRYIKAEASEPIEDTSDKRDARTW